MFDSNHICNHYRSGSSYDITATATAAAAAAAAAAAVLYGIFDGC